MDNNFQNIEDAVRRNCANGESCFWKLYICDNSSLTRVEEKSPNAKNSTNGNLNESVQLLIDNIAAFAPIAKRYIVIVLSSSKTDPSPIIMPFNNPHYRKRTGVGRVRGGMMGGGMDDRMFSLYLQQMQENNRLQMELMNKEHTYRTRAIIRKIKEQNEAAKVSGIEDRVMSVLDHPTLAPVIQGFLGKVLGIKGINTSDEEEDEEPASDLNRQEEEAIDVVRTRFQSVQNSLGSDVNVVKMLHVLMNYMEKHPDQAKMFYNQLKAQK
jgi:hypothetical protein